MLVSKCRVFFSSNFLNFLKWMFTLFCLYSKTEEGTWETGGGLTVVLLHDAACVSPPPLPGVSRPLRCHHPRTTGAARKANSCTQRPEAPSACELTTRHNLDLTTQHVQEDTVTEGSEEHRFSISPEF